MTGQQLMLLVVSGETKYLVKGCGSGWVALSVWRFVFRVSSDVLICRDVRVNIG